MAAAAAAPASKAVAAEAPGGGAAHPGAAAAAAVPPRSPAVPAAHHGAQPGAAQVLVCSRASTLHHLFSWRLALSYLTAACTHGQIAFCRCAGACADHTSLAIAGAQLQAACILVGSCLGA